MAFKIKDGIRIGTNDVFNNQGQLVSPKIKDPDSQFSASVSTETLTGNVEVTIPDTNGTLITTGDVGSVTSTMIANGTIVNDDINASAGIVDSKLATISTANKVSLSALDIDGATDIGAALVDSDLIVIDDGASGTNRKSEISRVSDYVFSKVSGDVVIGSTGTAVIQANSVELGTDTTGNYVATIAGTENQVSVSGSGNENAAITLSLPQNIHSAATPSFAGMTLTGQLSMQGVEKNKIINLANPEQAFDAATKEYVDEVAQGLRARTAADILVDTNLLASYDNGVDGVGATLTSTTDGPFPTIDGITLTEVSSRVLVTGQTNKAHNGLYVLIDVGSDEEGSEAPWVLRRCQECNEQDEIAGSFVFIQQGTQYANTGWVAIIDNPETFAVGSDDIDWIQFSGAGSIVAGTGLTRTGNTLSVNENLSHVTGLGTITSGTWQANKIDPTYGGTGVNNGSKTITLGGDFTHSGAHSLTVTTSGNTSVTLPTTGTLAIIGNGLNQFASTTSSQLADVISDETGSGLLVFNTSPTFSSSVVTDSSSINVFNTTATTVNAFGAATTLSIGSSTGTTTVNNELVVSGNLTVNGITTTIESETVTVKDKNIELGNVSEPSNATANGGGITLLAGAETNKTFNWLSATSSWTSSEHLNLVSGKEYRINGVAVLSGSALGTGITSSSLTSVGIIASGTWQGSVISPTYGGTGVDNGSKTITLGGNFTHSGAHSLSVTTTGNTSVILPTTGTLAIIGNGLNQFASTTSSQLAGVISDETGSGLLVFNTSPSFVSSVTTTSETLAVFNTTATTVNAFGAATTLSIGSSSGTTTVNNGLVVSGNLTVNGTTTTLNSSTLQVEDKNIELAKVAEPTDVTADGAGITIKGTVDKTFNWLSATSSWTSSEHLNLVSGKEYRINGVAVLSGSALGTGITSSSLTSLGTISLGTWQGSTIAVAHGGTGATTAGDARTNLGATTVGDNLFTLPNPSQIRFIRINADNTISALTAEEFRTALGAGAEVSTVVSTTTATAVDTWAVSTYRSAKYLVQITQGSSYQISEILVIHNGTTTFMTEYAVLETSGELATFTSDISSGNARLIITMNSATSATIKIDRTTITI
jgi:hypothetical protein